MALHAEHDRLRWQPMRSGEHIRLQDTPGEAIEEDTDRDDREHTTDNSHGGARLLEGGGGLVGRALFSEIFRHNPPVIDLGET